LLHLLAARKKSDSMPTQATNGYVANINKSGKQSLIVLFTKCYLQKAQFVLLNNFPLACTITRLTPIPIHNSSHQ